MSINNVWRLPRGYSSTRGGSVWRFFAAAALGSLATGLAAAALIRREQRRKARNPVQTDASVQEPKPLQQVTTAQEPKPVQHVAPAQEPRPLLQEAPTEEVRPTIYDGETGLYAPWYFALRTQEEMERCDRYGQLFLLLVAKAAPDLPGERKQALVDGMKGSFRATDIVAHLGDHRFAVLLPNTGLSASSAIEQRLVSRLVEGEVTIGFALYPGGGFDLAELLQAAESGWHVAEADDELTEAA